MMRPLGRVRATLICAALVTRAAPILLALAIHGDAHVSSEGDAYQYLELASSLASSGTFEREGLPELLRTPIYPLLLVPGTWLGAPVAIAVIAQILLGVAVTLMIFEMTAMLTNSTRVGALAAAIYLLEPGQPILAIAVMADAVLVAIVCVMTWVAIRYAPGAPAATRRIAIMAALVTAAAYTKPPAYFLGIALAIAIVASWWTKANRRTLVTHALALVLLNVLLVAPWHARNWAVAGYLGFSTQIERAAFITAPASLVSAQTGETYDRVRARTVAPSMGGEPGAEAMRTYRTRGMPLLVDGLPSYLWIHVKGSLLTLMAPPIYVWNYIVKNPMPPTRVGHGFLTGGIRGVVRELRAAPLRSTVLVTLFCLWSFCVVTLSGVALWTHRADPRLRVLGLLIVLWLLIVGGPNRESRHRAPFVPALCILAAIGLTDASRAFRSRRPIKDRTSGAAIDTPPS